MTQRQIQLRSHDADGACPSRRRPGLSLGANTHELIHTLPRPRYDREAAPRRRARSRIPAGSDAEPSPSRAGCPPNSRWRPPRGLDGVGTPRVTSRRRHPPATVITHRSPRVSPVSPSSLPAHSLPPQARHEVKIRLVSGERAKVTFRGGCVQVGFANDETMSATPPMSHPTRPGLDDLPDPPAAPRKKKPTRSRVFPAPADDDDATTTPAASRRRLVFGDGGEFDSPEGGGAGGAAGGAGGTRTPASPPMTRGRASGGKEPKTPPVSKIKSMPR